MAQPLVLVTGPSGAGRSTAINALEDLGFEAIDNIPISFVLRLLDGPPIDRPMALGLDPRNRDFTTPKFLQLIEDLGDRGDIHADVLYLHCATSILLRRYSETRRRHPLAPAESPETGIERELELLEPIKARADVLLDTSELSVHDLRDAIIARFDRREGRRLAISVQSFSYKRGLPHGVDTVFDVRFLKNPYWDESLREQNGTAAEVDAFVASDALFDAFFEMTVKFAELLLPAYLSEGKNHFSVGFGCTGGQHRSVVVTERYAKALAAKGWQVSIRHRELERRAALTASNLRSGNST